MAYTMMTCKDINFAGDLVRNLEGANQYVSKELLDLAMQVYKYTQPWLCLKQLNVHAWLTQFT